MAPLLTKKLMRHASIETTEAHYVDLSQVDARAALDGVPFGINQRGAAPSSEGASAAPECESKLCVYARLDAVSVLSSAMSRATGQDSLRSANRILESFKALSRTLQQGSRVERPKGLEPSTFSLGS